MNNRSCVPFFYLVLLIMPNHVHDIIFVGTDRAGLKPVPAKCRGLSEIVRGLKTFSAQRINELHTTFFAGSSSAPLG